MSIRLTEDTIKGAVYGLAFGDAWGYVTEFYPYSQLSHTRPLIPSPLVISDDTQMSLYVVDAITGLTLNNVFLPTPPPGLLNDEQVQNTVRKAFADEFVHFYNDPDNNRAPGTTCMTALSEYVQRTETMTPDKVTGLEGGHNNSKGCGANMRAPWLGLLPYKRDRIAVLAVLQAQTTHGHPTGQVAAAVTALLVHSLAHKKIVLSETLAHSFEILKELKSQVVSNVWIGAAAGFQEVEAGLRNIEAKIEEYRANYETTDINSYVGEGWVAEEALFNAILAVTVFPNNFKKAISELVYSNGDSDSIAAIGGAFWGAANGYEALYYDVANNLEPRYQQETEAAVYFLTNIQNPA